MNGLPGLVVRYRTWVIAGWAIIAAILIPAARRIDTVLIVAGARSGRSEAADVERRLATDFASPYARYAVLVATGIPQPTTPDGGAALSAITGALGHAPGVTRTLSFLSTHDTTFLGASGTFVVVGLSEQSRSTDDWIVGLRRISAQLQDSLRGRYPVIELQWTGNAALNYDVRSTTEEDAARAEHRIIPITLVLLVLVFGSVVAAVIPVIAAGLAIVVCLGLAAHLAGHWPLTLIVRNIATMMGLGVGVDYGLIMVSRFREGMAEGRDPPDAAEYALRHAGHTVLVSAAAVVVSFAALLLIPAAELRSIATGGLLVIGAAALIATTLLPAILAWLGPRLEFARLWPARGRRTGAAAAPDGIDASAGARRSSAWQAWGRWAVAHPWITLALGATPLVALGIQVRRLDSDMPSGDWLPRHAESAEAARSLAGMGKSGLIDALRVLVVLPDSARALSPGGWTATARVAHTLADDPRIASVRSLPTITGAVRPTPNFLAVLSPDAIRTFVSRDQRTAIVEVIPREGASLAAIVQVVRRLHNTDPLALTGLAGARVLIGGLPAFNAEYQDAVGTRAGRIIALVIAGTAIALFAGFRSVLVPLKAVVLNLLSVAAALGATVLVFQDGYGVRLLGLPGPIDGLFPAVPIIVFCVVFGLSMDYEVFLVARVAEAHRAGRSASEAVAEGLGRTGGVITSAAAVMVVVFAACALSEFLLIKILGLALAVAVLLDATLVRIAVGPALLRLAGRWNWWPGG
jgi:RND superfamily putative drug exporter